MTFSAAARPALSVPKMRPLFISSLARQSYYYLALVFPASTFNYPPFSFSYSKVRLGHRHTVLQCVCVCVCVYVCVFGSEFTHFK